MPANTARGGHVFRPSAAVYAKGMDPEDLARSAMHPSMGEGSINEAATHSLDDDAASWDNAAFTDELRHAGSSTLASAMAAASGPDSDMHLDNPPPSSSVGTGKRSHSISSENDHRSTRDTSVGSKRARVSARGSYAASRASTKSSRATSKLESSTAFAAMHGSFNQIADVIRETAQAPIVIPSPPPPPPPPPTADELIQRRRNNALHRMQLLDDGLTRQEKVNLVDLFRVDISVVDTYLALEEPELRQDWLHEILKTRP